MKKQLKRILSVVLCIAMLVPCIAIVGSAEEEPEIAPIESEAEYPIVFVTGIGQSYSYFYENVEDARKYPEMLEAVKNGTAGEGVREVDGAKTRWNLFCNDFSFAFKEPKTILSILAVAGGLLGTLFTGFNLIPKKPVDSIVTTLFRYNTIDENGDLPENVVTPRADCSVAEMTEEQKENFYRSIPCQDVIGSVGEDMLYCFNYSAFSFTFDNSDALDKFIDEVVLPQTGKDKVVLVPMSMGASVVSAYLHDYGTKGKVARVVSIVGAWLGSDILADLIELKFADDSKEKFYNGVISDLIGEPWGYLVNIILHLFRYQAGRGMVDTILNSIVENLVMKTPSLCGLVPPDRYPAIRAARLEGKPEKAYIMEQTDRYYDVQSSLKDTVTTLHDQYGVDFFYIAGYGIGFGDVSSDYEFFKFMNTANTTNSDEIIQISSTATGATFAKAGEELDASYIASHDAKYISPDKSVDISTCYFPDRVWLFGNQKHELENNNTALRLAFELACGKIDNNQQDTERYPIFNESRDLKKLKRSYIPDLEKWLETNTPTAEQQKLIDENTAAVEAMMARTINDRDADDEIINDYYEMLITLGVYGAPEEPGAFDSALNNGLKKANDIVWNIWGPKGFLQLF